jgi:regulator of protease activity HflC (stomatin/prohibitin superfamily)
MEKEAKIGISIGSVVLLVLVGVIILSMWGCPKYNVYVKDLAGKAVLSEAEWSRQIAIEEANAKKLSAVLLAEAEIERAKGVAQANEIIGESLKGNESYLRYLWIQGLQDGSSEVIYIPTEANLPILESVRKLQSKENNAESIDTD